MARLNLENFGHLLQKELNERGIKVAAGIALQMCDYLCQRPRLFVRPCHAQSVKDVGNCHDARCNRDGRTGESIGIPGTVPSLMVVACNARSHLQ